MIPAGFISKWSKSELKERSSCKEHFMDLGRLVDHPTPAEADLENLPRSPGLVYQQALREGKELYHAA